MQTHSGLSQGLTVQLPDENGVEPNRSPSTQVAIKKGLVAGNARSQIAVARLEHQPGLSGKSRIGETQST